MRYNQLIIWKCKTFITLIVCAITSGVAIAQVRPASNEYRLSLNLSQEALDTAYINRQLIEGSNIMVNKPDSAMRLFASAFVNSRALGYYQGIVMALINQGVIYYNLGDYDLAIDMLEKAIDPAEKSSSIRKDLVPAAYINLGNAWSHKGNYEKAAHYYNLAIEAAEKHSGQDEVIARIYTNYAGMLAELREFDRALNYLDKAEEVLRKSNLVKSLAILLYNKSATFSSLGRFKEAGAVLEDAIELSARIQDITVQKLCLSGRGALYIKEGRLTDAVRSIEKAYQLQPSTDPNIETGILLNLSEAYSKLQQYSLAVRYLHQLLSVAEVHGMSASVNAMEAHSRLSSLYAQTGNHTNAWKHLRHYVDIKDSLMGENKIRSIKQIEARYMTAQKDRELAQKKLLITQQKLYIQQNQTWAYVGTISAILLGIICTLLYRNIRHRKRWDKERLLGIQREQELEMLKISVNAEETERMRIGRELHDGVGGLLSALKMNLSVIQKQNRELEHSEAFRHVFTIADEATDELRKTAHNLVPEMLFKGGITEAVKNFCEHIPKNGPLEIKVITYGAAKRLNSKFELSLYRIIQELVNNIIKHAQASNALVQLVWQENQLNITVEDDGIGFDTVRWEQNGQTGIGLKNIRARVSALNGHMEVESLPAKGTTVELEFTF